MKKIGIVGGVAWRSTVEYYADICRRAEEMHLAQRRPGPPASPEMVIESLDLNTAFAAIGNDEDESSWSRFDEYHRAALLRLERSGAEMALIASNTPHHRFREITRGVRIPVVSILAATAAEAKIFIARLYAYRKLTAKGTIRSIPPRIHTRKRLSCRASRKGSSPTRASSESVARAAASDVASDPPCPSACMMYSKTVFFAGNSVSPMRSLAGIPASCRAFCTA